MNTEALELLKSISVSCERIAVATEQMHKLRLAQAITATENYKKFIAEFDEKNKKKSSIFHLFYLSIKSFVVNRSTTGRNKPD